MSSPPTGTITFLFTDIEGSTRLWEESPDKMSLASARHDAIIRNAIETNNGYIVKYTGDGFHAAFISPLHALNAAILAQQTIYQEHWPEPLRVRVRMGLHTGTAELRSGDYFGAAVNRAERYMSAGHGGQVLLSAATFELIGEELPSEVDVVSLGDHKLRDLQNPVRIFQLRITGLEQEFSPLKTLEYLPNNLPLQPTLFVGREQICRSITKLLHREEVRLVTLTGPGGIGKTRLGIHVAAELLENFHDGVFFVTLASLTDPNLVASAIAHTLGIRDGGRQSVREGLQSYLQDREMLLVLDNFEQVISAAPIVSSLLATCSHLKILVTSREVLRLRGEHEFPVPPLGMNVAFGAQGNLEYSQQELSQYEAMELFIQCARAAKPDFEITNENAPAVAEICYKLDGLPLAIELAAARIKVMSPQAMLKWLTSRFKFLRGGPRDLPERHQTLQQAIAWSYDLLTTEEQHVFRTLTVFADGFTLLFADTILSEWNDSCVHNIDVISSLINKSLLRSEELRDGTVRYRMLETIREFGLEQLSISRELQNTWHKLAVSYSHWVKDLDVNERVQNQTLWLQQLDTEYGNIRSILQWTGTQDHQIRLIGAQIVGYIWQFWMMRGYASEGRRQIELILGSTIPLAPKLHAELMTGLGSMAWLQNDFAQATIFHSEALELYRQIDDLHGIAFSLNNIATQQLDEGVIQNAKEIFESSLSIARQCNSKVLIYMVLNNLGELLRRQGNYIQAIPLLEEALALARAQNNLFGVVVISNGLATARIVSNDLTNAAVCLKEGLLATQQVGDGQHMVECLDAVIALAMQRKHFEKATLLLGAVDRLRHQMKIDRMMAERVRFDGYVEELQLTLTPEGFTLLRQNGWNMPSKNAITIGLEEVESCLV